MPTKKRATKANRILVVGDWMIDDYWALGIHRSPTASRVGQQHFRALNPPNSIVQTFAGAGRVASLLCHAKIREQCPWSIVGFGLWHKNDTRHLCAMFERDVFRGWTPSQVARDFRSSSDEGPAAVNDDVSSRIELVNFADLLSPCRGGITAQLAWYAQISRLGQHSNSSDA